MKGQSGQALPFVWPSAPVSSPKKPLGLVWSGRMSLESPKTATEIFVTLGKSLPLWAFISQFGCICFFEGSRHLKLAKPFAWGYGWSSPGFAPDSRADSFLV